MCIGDDPFARALPYLIATIIFGLITATLYTIPKLKNWNTKYARFAKKIMLLITLALLSLTLFQFGTRFKCM